MVQWFPTPVSSRQDMLLAALNVLRMKYNLLYALVRMQWICFDHVKSFDRMTPRSFVENLFDDRVSSSTTPHDQQVSYPHKCQTEAVPSLLLPIITYASPVWRPSLLKDIKALELFQRATKYIVDARHLSYKSRLLKLNLLLLMYRLELHNIMFFVHCCKNLGTHLNIKEYVGSTHDNTATTRSHSSFKLKHTLSKTSLQRHIYVNRIPRFWNRLHLAPTL